MLNKFIILPVARPDRKKVLRNYSQKCKRALTAQVPWKIEKAPHIINIGGSVEKGCHFVVFAYMRKVRDGVLPKMIFLNFAIQGCNVQFGQSCRLVNITRCS